MGTTSTALRRTGLMAGLVSIGGAAIIAVFAGAPTAFAAEPAGTRTAVVERIPTFTQDSQQHPQQIGWTDGQVHPVGTTVENDRWAVSAGKVVFGQNAEVLAASPFNIPAPDGLTWVTLPVTIESKLDVTATPGGLNIQLRVRDVSISHEQRVRHHYPAQTLPNELEMKDFHPGESRQGNVGWLVLTELLRGECSIEVTLLDSALDRSGETTLVACS